MSPTIKSPGFTTIPPTDTGKLTSPGPRCSGPIGVTPRANTGKSPSDRIPGRSRTSPSTTNPAMPRWRAFVLTRSPSTAWFVVDAASTTITSPGRARSRLLCTIRLSPGNTLTVQAGPRIRNSGAVTLWISQCMVKSRFIRSDMDGVSKSANPSMTAWSGRSMCDLIRKPGPGCISAVFGFLAVPPVLVALAIAEAYLLPSDAWPGAHSSRAPRRPSPCQSRHPVIDV